MGFLVIFFRFKPVLSTCIWQFTNRKKFLCLTVMVKTQTTTQAALSCFAIWKQFISPSGQHLKSIYGFIVWTVISLFLCFFGYSMSHQKTTKNLVLLWFWLCNYSVKRFKSPSLSTAPPVLSLLEAPISTA